MIPKRIAYFFRVVASEGFTRVKPLSGREVHPACARDAVELVEGAEGHEVSKSFGDGNEQKVSNEQHVRS